jgi:putative heme iron utilization protein
MWNFHAVRKVAIERLSQMLLKPVDKVVLAYKYNISDWLVPALNQLAQQASIEEDEAERIAQVSTWGYVLKLMKVRESLAENRGGTCVTQRCPHCSSHDDEVRCRNCHGYYNVTHASTGGSSSRHEHDFAATIRTVFSL